MAEERRSEDCCRYSEAKALKAAGKRSSLKLCIVERAQFIDPDTANPFKLPRDRSDEARLKLSPLDHVVVRSTLA